MTLITCILDNIDILAMSFAYSSTKTSNEVYFYLRKKYERMVISCNLSKPHKILSKLIDI